MTNGKSENQPSVDLSTKSYELTKPLVVGEKLFKPKEGEKVTVVLNQRQAKYARERGCIK